MQSALCISPAIHGEHLALQPIILLNKPQKVPIPRISSAPAPFLLRILSDDILLFRASSTSPFLWDMLFGIYLLTLH
jgi:hypothetical protein